MCNYSLTWALLHLMLLVATSNGKAITYYIQKDVGTLFSPKSSSIDVRFPNTLPGFNCTTAGFFAIAGYPTHFYKCQDFPVLGLTAFLCICLTSSTYDDAQEKCNPNSQGATRHDCVLVKSESIAQNITMSPVTDITQTSRTPIIHRSKRKVSGLSVLGGVSSGLGIVSSTLSIANTIKNWVESSSSKASKVEEIENRLDCVAEGLQGLEKSVLASRIENIYYAKVTQNLVQKGIAENRVNFANSKSLLVASQKENEVNAKKTQTTVQQGIDENKLNFEKTQYLLGQSMLENKLNAARTQGLLIKGQIANEMNFLRIQGSIRDVKNLINQGMNKSISYMEQGFLGVINAIHQSRITKLLSQITTSIKTYTQRKKHVLDLPRERYEDEMTRDGGYIDFLESSELHDNLLHVIHQKFAIPRNSSDVSFVPMIDLLVDGLQVHANMLASIVTSFIYLAGDALEDKNLHKFDTYVQRASSSINHMKRKLLFVTEYGLCNEVKKILNTVSQLQFKDDIEGLTNFLKEKQLDLKNIISFIQNFISAHHFLSEPGLVHSKLNFMNSSLSLPIGPWESGVQVTYAAQLISQKAISPVGEWSKPYTISDKGNPVVYLPTVGEGEIRLIYRKFGENKPELVATITDRSQDSFRDINRDLINAVSNPNEDIALPEVESLLDDGADISVTIEKSLQPLHYAAKYGNIKIMQLLLNRSADLHAKTLDGETALHFSAMYNHANAIEFLIKKGSFINSYTRSLGWTPLHVAVVNDHIDAVRKLVNHKASINAKDNTGLTPLHLSTLGSGHTMEILLAERHIDVNVKAFDGQTPLHSAASSSNPSLVKKIIEHPDVEIDSYNNAFKSPLHYAALTETTDNINSLIQHGASPFIFDLEGSSPIHFAALYGKKKSISKLTEEDQSVESAKNWDREYAVDLVLGRKRREIMPLLRNSTELLNDCFDKAFKDTSGISIAGIDCANGIAEELVTLSEENCLHIGQITNYIDVIRSKVSVPLLEDHYVFTEAIINYNTVLQKVQDNVLAWKYRNNILKTTEQIFLVTKKFEGLFEKRYKIMQQKLGQLPSMSATNKLQELTAFLELVKDDALKVQQAAARAKQIFLDLQDTTNADIEELRNSFNDAKMVFRQAENQKIAHQPTLKFFQDREDQLTSDIKKRKASIPKVTKHIYTTYKEVRNVRMGILKRIEHLPTRRFATTIPSPKSSIIAELLVPLETTSDKDEVEKLTKVIYQHKTEVKSITNHVHASEDIISQYQKLVFAGSVASKTNQSDFDAFKKLECSLEGIVEMAPSTQSSILGVISTLEKIEDAFSIVTDSFVNMIITGRSTTQVEESVNSINTRLSQLQCYWKDIGVRMVDLKECSKNFYFISPEQNLVSSKC